MKQRRPPRVYPTLAAYLAGTGTTQAELAAAVGSTQVTIHRVVIGERIPRPALALKLARYCRVPLDSFTRVYLAAHGQTTEESLTR